MKLSRPHALRIHFVLDQLLPPALRDSRWFMSLPFRIAYGTQAHVFMDFKENAPRMTDEEFVRTYRTVGPVQMDRDIHVTPACRTEVMKLVLGQDVLDVGCGKGVLAGELSASHRTTAVDILVDPAIRTAFPNVRFLEANAECLPFEDRSFDTVVCTHTLEHVLDLPKAIRELRRVARRRIIVVVPKQRPYRFTFDLHLHFFPYAHSLLETFRPSGSDVVCREIGGDLLYSEDIIA